MQATPGATGPARRSIPRGDTRKDKRKYGHPDWHGGRSTRLFSLAFGISRRCDRCLVNTNVTNAAAGTWLRRCGALARFPTSPGQSGSGARAPVPT